VNDRELIKAMVGEDYRHLYTHNAWFRTGVDTFAQMVPIFLDGLATQAAGKDEEMQRQYEAAMRAPMMTFEPPPLTEGEG